MTLRSIFDTFQKLFLGAAPGWYKFCIIAFLVLNPLLLVVAGPFVAGWLLVAEFIFTLAMALTCYPLQAGGLLAVEAIAIGLASPASVYAEVAHNLPVLLLLMFMVAGIFFMKELLLAVFTRLLLGVGTKWLLSLLFCTVAALLAAFLDALTVTAVVITVVGGFYAVYHNAAAPGMGAGIDGAEREEFRAFLRSLLMHAAVGTTLGGVATLVGQPQNLLIGRALGWDFMEFLQRMAPVALPVIVAGLLMVVVLERWRLFGYGAKLPVAVRAVLQRHAQAEQRRMDAGKRMVIAVQAVAGMLLIAALAWHVAEVGLIGLALLVVVTAFTGVTEERRLARAFEEAMPFTALLAVFFAVVAVIHAAQLFTPLITWVLGFEGRAQLALLYAANGLLSAVSDNVFVATVYMNQVQALLAAGQLSHAQYALFAIAINSGTNIPSVATPNGQAAFLFLLTSGIAPLVRLSYLRMVWMALPYTVVLTLVGLLALLFLV
ncbi:MAG: sodium/proton antiporter NhaB [Gammaproteobacteria bacterium]|nr:sodium/proton antiporter NhaB [Gammaproteobacteria bacterium]